MTDLVGLLVQSTPRVLLGSAHDFEAAKFSDFVAHPRVRLDLAAG